MSTDPSQTTASLPKAWRHVITLQVIASESGLVAINAYDPRNIGATGHSLTEALTEVVPIIEQLQAAGVKFACLDGVKLK